MEVIVSVENRTVGSRENQTDRQHAPAGFVRHRLKGAHLAAGKHASSVHDLRA